MSHVYKHCEEKRQSTFEWRPYCEVECAKCFTCVILMLSLKELWKVNILSPHFHWGWKDTLWGFMEVVRFKPGKFWQRNPDVHWIRQAGLSTLNPVQVLGLLLRYCKNEKTHFPLLRGRAAATVMGLLRLRPPQKVVPSCSGGVVLIRHKVSNSLRCCGAQLETFFVGPRFKAKH